MHEDVALEFARWLSPKFAIWCNDRIKELLTAPKPTAEAEVLPSTPSDEKCLVFFADSEEMCNFAAFTREGHSFKASPENINGIKSAEVSCVSNGVHLNGVSSLVNSTHPRTFLFMFTRENQVCLYNGSPVTFKLGDGTTSVNATQMAKPFGKLVGGWLRLESTKEFLNALSADMRIHTSALIQTVKGGNGEQGTWMHEDVALEFARWLSPKFAIWCNRRIKELLTAPQQPQKAEILPPPIDNSQVFNGLVEVADGKSVTTSRKLALVLGRKHDSILGTIKDNLHRREFKYGHFTMRDYSDSRHSHGYEYMITRRGLEVLAGLMRYGAKEKIAEAYAGAWSEAPQALPPALAQPALPLSEEAPAEPVGDDTDCDEISYTPEQQKYIDWLEGYNEKLGERLCRAKETMRMYAEMYSIEKERHLRSEIGAAYWHDLYEDLMLRLNNGDNCPLAEKMEAHRAFRKRISKGVC